MNSFFNIVSYHSANLVEELASDWDVKWSTGSISKYRINNKDSTIEIISCDWSNCAMQKKVKISASSSTDYPAGDGWLEAKDLHSGTLSMFLKKEEEGLKIVWYRPDTGYKVSGLGIKGESKPTLTLCFRCLLF